MAWVRIDDQAPRNAKMLKAGPAACWLWVCGIAHCQSQLTDGFISLDVLPMIGIAGAPRAKRLAEALVEAGLFDRADGGYQVHDYLALNDSREKVLQKRADDAARKAARNPGGFQPDSGAPCADGPASARPRPIPSQPILTHPEGELSASASANGNGLRERFAEFWKHYPRKVAKVAAWRAWQKLRPDNDLLATMLAVLVWQKNQDAWVKDRGQFVPHPATWLNQGRWQDEPTSGSTADRYAWTCPHDPKCSGRHECHIKTTLEAART